MKYVRQFYQKIVSLHVLIGLICLQVSSFIIRTPDYYLFEWLDSLAFQVFIIECILFFWLVVERKWPGILTISLAIGLLYLHFPFSLVQQPVKASCGDITIVHFNVLKANQQYDKTIQTALRSEADIISFCEVTTAWADQLERQLKETYPYYSIIPNNGSFGIGIFSKHSISDIDTLWYAQKPSLVGNITINNQDIHFVTTHTIPPTTKHFYAQRNSHLQNIANYLSEIDGPKMLIGDLNAVSWSDHITALLQKTNMKDSRKTYSPTYPSWNAWLCIPINHIFYSEELICSDFRTIQIAGSDHYGVLGEYIFTDHGLFGLNHLARNL